MKTETFYMLLYLNGDYVAIDENSGGCPYPTKDYVTAKKWSSKLQAEKYPNKFETFTLCEAIVTIKPI